MHARSSIYRKTQCMQGARSRGVGCAGGTTDAKRTDVVLDACFQGHGAPGLVRQPGPRCDQVTEGAADGFKEQGRDPHVGTPVEVISLNDMKPCSRFGSL